MPVKVYGELVQFYLIVSLQLVKEEVPKVSCKQHKASCESPTKIRLGDPQICIINGFNY